MKALNSPLKKEIEFEPHHRSPLTKTMTDNWHNRQKDNLTSTEISMNMIDSGKDSLIDNDNNSLTNSKVTDRAISITYKDKEKDELKRETSLIGIMHEEKKRQNINNIKDKEMIKKGVVKEMKEMFERKDSDSVVKVKVEKVVIVNKKDKKCNSLKEKIDERLKLIERSIIDTQNDSLTELTKNMKILNTPLEIDRKRDIAVLNTIVLSDNEKTDRYVSNTICHKYGHTKKQCDRHNKIIKQISKLEFENDIINELMEIFHAKQKEIDQVMKKEEIKSTNPLKINKRKRKQKDIIMKLIENLPHHHKDKTEYLLKLKDSIEIPIACIRCRKYGHHVTECRKKEKTKIKQDRVDIKPVTLQDLMTEEKMVKQEIKDIKEDNSTYINEQNIVELINLKELSTPMIDLSSLEDDILDNDNNKQKILSLIDRVIFQKWHIEITLIINKEFSLTEIALIDSGADMNCIQ